VKTWIVPVLAVCLLGAAACSDHGSKPQALAVPKASGFPSETEYAAISAAATQLAAERAAKPCPSVTDCHRTTVFVDGKPISDSLVVQVAQGLLVHDFGGQATAARLTSLMRDERSAFVRRVLTSTAYSALLRLDAASALSAAQRREVEARLRAAEQAAANGTISLGGSQGPTAAQLDTLRSVMEEQTLTAAIAKQADPGGALRDLIRAALRKHRVDFTPGTGLHDGDVLAYAALAATSA